MQTFKTIKEIQLYIVDAGWTQANGKPVTLDALKKASQAKKFKARRDGLYHSADIDKYCSSIYINPFLNPEADSIKDKIEKEKLRKLQIENDKKMGELVSLSEEVKRRVAIIQGMKTAMVNGKASFMRQLRASMKERHKECDILNDMLSDAADFYEDAVLTVFDAIGAKGKL